MVTFGTDGDKDGDGDDDSKGSDSSDDDDDNDGEEKKTGSPMRQSYAETLARAMLLIDLLIFALIVLLEGHKLLTTNHLGLLQVKKV